MDNIPNTNSQNSQNNPKQKYSQEEYEAYQKIVRDKWQEYKEEGFKTFSSFGRSNEINTDHPSLRDKYNKEDVIKWFTNPDKYKNELTELSSYMYIGKGLYYKMVNFYTNLPTLDYVLVPNFMDFSDKEKVLKECQKVKTYCDDILDKQCVRKILKAILKDGCFYGYERKLDTGFYIQKLNPKYCRQGSKLYGGLPSIEFNFKYFKNNESKLELYPQEFKRLYNKSKRDKNDWQELDYKYTMCIPLESEDYTFPALTGILDDLIDLDEFYKFLKDTTELDTVKAIVQSVLINKDTGDIPVPPDIVREFQNSIAEILPSKIKVISTPFDIHEVKFTQNKGQENTGIPEMQKLITTNSGVSGAIIGNDTGATATKFNYEINVAYVFAILEKLESWMKQRLKTITAKKYPFKMEFLRTTNINKKEMFDMSYRMLAIGGSLSIAISSMGINPESYFALLRMENMQEIKDLLQVPISMNTVSAKDLENEGGAPTKDAGDLADGGEKSKDTDNGDATK